jgi:hypothetical protein
MLLRFSSQLFLAFTILAVPQFATSTADSMLCSSLARASDVEDFGEGGQDGTIGQKGQNGRNSDGMTVFADGSPMTLDLSGENGFAGNSGTNGGTAICETELREKSKNLQASNGGSGGDGGDGGNGGNGGSLTIYTTDKSYLQQIYVVATGGTGGDPGQGGQGGEGCRCPVSNWDEQTCKGENCTTQELQCADGYDGRIGRNGRVGGDGRIGNLTVINLDKSLAPDHPQAVLTLQELQDRGFTLSKNEWKNKTGATSLLAPGSIVADEYKELVARHERTVLLVWDASQPVSDFAEEEVTLSLDRQNNPKLTFPDDLWLETSTIQREQISEFFVFNAVREKDVTRLKEESLSGMGKDLKLSIVDEAQKSDVLKTDFSVRYRVSKSSNEARFFRVFDYKTKYEGKIPPEAMTQNGDRFTINVGQLPIPPEDLQLGTAIEIVLVANRSFADKYSKEQKIIVREVIERN